MERKKRITIMVPCRNEEQNVVPMYEALRQVAAGMPHYAFDYLFIDNASGDRTRAILRQLASRDPDVRVILNARNFGQLRSPYHALRQIDADAALTLSCDFQEPPELIPEFIKAWEAGNQVVAGVRIGSREPFLLKQLRRFYYTLVVRMAEVPLIENFTGFGLYDRQVLEVFRRIDDPDPYLRGIVSEIGFQVGRVQFHQAQRRTGLTKNNFFTLYDLAMNGITSHTKVLLRLVTFIGFFTALGSFLAGLFYLGYKVLYWDQFEVGMAPLVIGQFFFNALILIFLGILGEYVMAINTRVLKRPLVVEAERINFPARPAGDAVPTATAQSAIASPNGEG